MMGFRPCENGRGLNVKVEGEMGGWGEGCVRGGGVEGGCIKGDGDVWVWDYKVGEGVPLGRVYAGIKLEPS